MKKFSVFLTKLGLILLASALCLFGFELYLRATNDLHELY